MKTAEIYVTEPLPIRVWQGKPKTIYEAYFEDPDFGFKALYGKDTVTIADYPGWKINRNTEWKKRWDEAYLGFAYGYDAAEKAVNGGITWDEYSGLWKEAYAGMNQTDFYRILKGCENVVELVEDVYDASVDSEDIPEWVYIFNGDFLEEWDEPGFCDFSAHRVRRVNYTGNSWKEAYEKYIREVFEKRGWTKTFREKLRFADTEYPDRFVVPVFVKDGICVADPAGSYAAEKDVSACQPASLLRLKEDEEWIPNSRELEECRTISEMVYNRLTEDDFEEIFMNMPYLTFVRMREHEGEKGT